MTTCGAGAEGARAMPPSAVSRDTSSGPGSSSDQKGVRSWWRNRRACLRRLEHFFAGLGVFFLTYFAFFNVSRVASPSMAPTLRGTNVTNGDVVLAEKVTYRFREPRRWEIVAFLNIHGNQVMKRVVGFPGEEIACRDGRVVINDRALDPPPSLAHLRYMAAAHLSADRCKMVRGGYFVLGDNIRDSYDSRFEGPVPAESVTGRAWAILWPPRRMRLLVP